MMAVDREQLKPQIASEGPFQSIDIFKRDGRVDNGVTAFSCGERLGEDSSHGIIRSILHSRQYENVGQSETADEIGWATAIGLTRALGFTDDLGQQKPGFEAQVRRTYAFLKETSVSLAGQEELPNRKK